MGLPPFGSGSYSRYDRGSDRLWQPHHTTATQPRWPNPNPENFIMKRSKQVGPFWILFVTYPDCKNYEGNKILVYQDVLFVELRAQGSLDPHFCDNPDFHSPIARFVPTDEGWDMACRFCEMMV